MFFRVLCLCLIPVYQLFGLTFDGKEICIQDAIPEWVVYCDFPDPTITESSEENVQALLRDAQENWEEKCAYVHEALRPLKATGVSEVAQITIVLDPSYQKAIIHGIHIYREGCYLDRLQSARCQILQRETDLKNDLVDGHLTIVYHLEDIREGDIVEYSYTIVGTLPYLSSFFESDFNLQSYLPVQRWHQRFLLHPSHALQIKPFYTAVEPKITDLATGLREWVWYVENTPAYKIDEDEPLWYDVHAHVQISENTLPGVQ